MKQTITYLNLILLLLCGNAVLGQAPQGVPGELNVTPFLQTHAGTLADLYPALGEGLFMRYPPPQGPAFEKPVKLQLSTLEIREGFSLKSWQRLNKILSGKEVEQQFSAAFKLEPKGSERTLLPFQKLGLSSVLRKRPGRAKFQITGIVWDAASFESSERFRRDSQFVIRCQVVHDDKTSFAGPVYVGIRLE